MSYNILRASNENISMAKKYSNYSCDIVEIFCSTEEVNSWKKFNQSQKKTL